MASPGLYASARTLFLQGGLNWTASVPVWRLLLLTADYVVDRAAHSTLADLPAGSVAGSGDVLGRSAVQGDARAADVVVSAGIAGPRITQAVLVCGEALVWWSDATPDLPFVTDGSENLIQWDSVAQGPFSL